MSVVRMMADNRTFVDAHTHLWKLDRGDYHWLTPGSGVLYRDFLFDDLEPALKACGVSGIILVQAAQTWAETAFMLSLADRHAAIRGVVGWLDVDSDRFDVDYAAAVQHPSFRGIRLTGSALGDLDNEVGAARIRRLSRLAEGGFSLDVNLRPEELASLARLLDSVPNLKVAVNHLGAPPVGTPSQILIWREGIRLLASNPNVSCKLSGMLTLAGGRGPDSLRPYAEALLESFGPSRLMYGSDWPVCLIAGRYEETIRLLGDSLPADIDESARAMMTGGNALSFYGVDVG